MSTPQILDIEDDPTAESLQEILDSPEPTDGQVSFASIFAQLLEHKDIILEIQSQDIDALRTGLTDAKYRVNQKAAKAGLAQDKRRIECLVLTPALADGSYPEQVQVRVQIKSNGGIKVLGLTTTEQEM